MFRDNGKGILFQDFSGTLMDGPAPQTMKDPSADFVETVKLHAFDNSGLTPTEYMERVFKGSNRLSPRFYVPFFRQMWSSLGQDVWHVLSKEEIMVMNLQDSKGLKGHSLREEEARDLEKVSAAFSIMGCTGQLYANRVDTLATVEPVKGVFDSLTLSMDINDTGLKIKYAGTAYVRARIIEKGLNIKLGAREDCERTALAVSEWVDFVSLVNPKSKNFDAMHFGMPRYIGARPERIIHGRLAQILEY